MLLSTSEDGWKMIEYFRFSIHKAWQLSWEGSLKFEELVDTMDAMELSLRARHSTQLRIENLNNNILLTVYNF